jgi:hypothetical protein
MRFFIALVVFSVGVGLWAAAALLFDRRRLLIARSAARRTRAAGTGGTAGDPLPAADPMPLYLTIAGCLLGGTVLMVGSCAGVIVW